MAASKVKPARTANIVKRAAAHADVLLLCEVFNVRVAEHLPGWHVVQPPGLGSSRSTVAVAIRATRGRVREESETRPVGPSLGGRTARNLRARSWVTARLLIDGDLRHWPLKASAGHAPPMRGWFLWPAYRATAPSGLLGADWNRLKDFVRRAFPRRKVRMVRLLGFAVPSHIDCTPAHPIDVGGDHLAAAITLWPNRPTRRK